MIIQRYIFKEVSLTFLATMLVLLLIIIGNTFVRLLARVSTGDLPLDVLSKMVFLGAISISLQLIPIALMIGMMLAFGRLYQDHEMEALNAAGVGPLVFYQGIYLFVAPLTLFMAVMVLFIVPHVESIAQEVKSEVEQRPEAAGIPVGEFMQAGKGNKQATLFIEFLDEKNVVMKHFFMHTQQDDTESIVLAEGAILFLNKNSGDRVLQINNGSRYDRNIVTEKLQVFRFGEHGVRVPPLHVNRSIDLDTFTLFALLEDNSLPATAELHWRFAVILAAPIMAFLAFPLSYSTPRQGRYGKLALGIVLFAIYFNLLITGRSMIEKSSMPAGLGLWWVHGLFVLLAGWLLWRRYGERKVVVQ